MTATILVATRSRHKLEELRTLLHLPDRTLTTLDEMGIGAEAVEDARTFKGNAILKARYYAGLAGVPTLADDSGLEVDALGGDPGVRTRRYAGEQATDEQNNRKLLGALEGVAPARRNAHYVCVLAYLDPTDANGGRSGRRRFVVTRSGRFDGRIALAPRGDNGFGYDPIFEPASEPIGGRTVGQLSSDEKNRISHRAKAARAMARYLREHSGNTEHDRRESAEVHRQ
jgi:XTP/dITP diphosphohydrolase